MKRDAKLLYIKAKEISYMINSEYNKLSLGVLFDIYHDEMRCQKDCIEEHIGIMEHYCKIGKLSEAKELLMDFNDTLVYCKAVIKLQTMANDMPKAIFG